MWIKNPLLNPYKQRLVPLNSRRIPKFPSTEYNHPQHFLKYIGIRYVDTPNWMTHIFQKGRRYINKKQTLTCVYIQYTCTYEWRIRRVRAHCLKDFLILSLRFNGISRRVNDPFCAKWYFIRLIWKEDITFLFHMYPHF